MISFARIALFAALLAARAVDAVGLPDTGQDLCFNDTDVDSVTVARDGGTHPRQDCRFGRDAAAGAGVLTKTGGGPRGFDYTKIANNGTEVPAGAALGVGAADWACTRDNITGLTWEVKTINSSDFRFVGRSYNWYSTDTSNNGGNSGSANGNFSCTPSAGSACDTQAFAAAVNAARLCSYNDWRVPSRREIMTLYFGNSILSAAQDYLPNFFGSFWTSTTHAAFPANAVDYDSHDGRIFRALKTQTRSVILVRGAPL